MHFHWTNDNEHSDGTTGSAFWKGRAWWRGTKWRIALQWLFGRNSRHTMFDFSRLEGRKISFAIGIHFLFALFVTISLPWIPERRWDNQREFRLSFSEGYVIFAPWRDPGSWSQDNPWWDNTYVFSPADFLLGRQRHSERDLYTVRSVVDMPEGNYPATIRVFESTWTRPRWFRKLQVIRADIEMDIPIPIPGKGENSWDLDDNGIESMCVSVTTVDEAVNRMRESAMQTRRRYGGEGWMPKAEEHVGCVRCGKMVWHTDKFVSKYCKDCDEPY